MNYAVNRNPTVQHSVLQIARETGLNRERMIKEVDDYMTSLSNDNKFYKDVIYDKCVFVNKRNGKQYYFSIRCRIFGSNIMIDDIWVSTNVRDDLLTIINK
jgi:hypothetical protein